MLISVKPLAKNLCISWVPYMKSSASKSKPFQSRSKLKGEIPGLSFSFFFFFYGLPFLESQFKAIILNKDCHDCYYTVINTQNQSKKRPTTTHLGGSDVVCVHNMNKMGWVVESPMNYTIECCHGDACLGLSESRRFVESWSLPTAFDDQSMFYSDDVLSLPQRRLQSQYGNRSRRVHVRWREWWSVAFLV